MHTVLIYGTQEAVHSVLMAGVISMGYRIIEQHIVLSSSFSRSTLSVEEKLEGKGEGGLFYKLSLWEIAVSPPGSVCSKDIAGSHSHVPLAAGSGETSACPV